MNITKYFVKMELIRRRQKKQRQVGAWISPVLGGLALLAIFAGAYFGLFRGMNNTASVHIESQQLMSILSGARQLKSGGSFANVDNAALQRIEAFGSMTGSGAGGTVRNGWGGTVVVTGTTSQLEIQYNGVPAKVCDSFLASATNSGEFATPLPTCGTTGATALSFIAY